MSEATDDTAAASSQREVLGTRSVLGKATVILNCYTDARRELSLTELTAATGLAKASVYRLASELVGSGFLEKHNARYRLGMRLFELGQLVPRQRILRDAARTFLLDLVQATQETAHLAIRSGLDVIYVDKLHARRGVEEISRVAGKQPIHATATGKILLAYGSPEVLGSLIHIGLAPVTQYTVTSPSVLQQQMDRIRAQGFSIEAEEIRLGLMSLAVPIELRSGLAVAALSLTGPITRMKPHQARYVDLLHRAARGISDRLYASERYQ